MACATRANVLMDGYVRPASNRAMTNWAITYLSNHLNHHVVEF